MNPEANCVDQAEQALRRVFGFEQFRGVQRDVVERVLAGQSTLTVMPTGAGKSLTYQLPATMLPGTCIVISPLIALMHDQLRAARANGIRAATLTSVDEDRAATVQAFRNGELDLLYVAPERASQGHFRELLEQAPLALFAVDEAHCVSEWGHDFRPDYRQLRPLMDAFPVVPRLGLTATADERTRADILEQLGIPEDGLVISGFDRPNIRYAVRHRENALRQIADLMAQQPGSGIVYAPSRKKVEELAERLAERTGRRVLPYHADLFREQHAYAERIRDVFDSLAWTSGRWCVVVAAIVARGLAPAPGLHCSGALRPSVTRPHTATRPSRGGSSPPGRRRGRR